ncbi:porin family protein [Vreelandella jeotgali]|uniref:porin family protein n=1 Tax=Vreelandella jeotgali TaxID=553386 RepID=UPI000346AF44|nr:porin family protein [Halomonas jeotgali]
MKQLTLATLTAAVFAAGVATTAQAQQPAQPMQATPYIGADAMLWEVDPDYGSSRDSVGLRLNGGMQFNQYFAVEAQAGTGGSDGYAELDYLVGAYAKGILPINNDIRLYGLAGATKVDFDYSSESDFSYGAGAEIDVAPRVALGADYMRYLDESSYTFDAASVGVKYRF